MSKPPLPSNSTYSPIKTGHIEYLGVGGGVCLGEGITAGQSSAVGAVSSTTPRLDDQSLTTQFLKFGFRVSSFGVRFSGLSSMLAGAALSQKHAAILGQGQELVFVARRGNKGVAAVTKSNAETAARPAVRSASKKLEALGVLKSCYTCSEPK